LFILAVSVLSLFASPSQAQRRDFVTEPESELIREFQEIDFRIEALTKFIDRRLAAAGIPGHTWVLPKKNAELWGEEPKGTKLELLYDIKRLLQKSIDDIDDIASRTSNAIEENNTGGKLFPKAVRNLATAAARYKPIFQAELEKTKADKERGLLLDSIEFCNQITEAAANLPPEIKEEKKKKKT
ncbi:MAG TPA: hypothetical protein VK612_08150, partial [Pyrinomonadaceae bacterium]|nr:hypothetical protein [Pyrinomonadaceae bacterium]